MMNSESNAAVIAPSSGQVRVSDLATNLASSTAFTAYTSSQEM